MLTLTGATVGGEVTIPSSKSQTIRACLIALAARSVSIISNPLVSADTQSCFSALEKLGCTLSFDESSNTLTVDSTKAAKKDGMELDLGNSGTTTYLIYGILATLGPERIRIYGDSQLNRRPIKPLCDAYADLGVRGDCTGSCPPVSVSGTLEGGKTSIECPTSQYLSSLLLSLPLAKRDSEVVVPLLYEKPYVRMTLDWLDREGIRYRMSEDLQHFWIPGGQSYPPFNGSVAGDWSSAAFFLASAAITGCTLTLKGLDINDSQGDRRMLDILSEMGCTIDAREDGVTITGPERLHGGEYDINDIPDCLPALSILGTRTDSPLRLYNVANARIKETDRIRVMAENLSLLGIRVEEEEAGLVIHPGRLEGGITVPCHADHRIIMAFSVLSLVSHKPLTIDDERAASVTFPTFFTLFESIKEERK